MPVMKLRTVAERQVVPTVLTQRHKTKRKNRDGRGRATLTHDQGSDNDRGQVAEKVFDWMRVYRSNGYWSYWR
jgi:hypothetical protein